MITYFKIFVLLAILLTISLSSSGIAQEMLTPSVIDSLKWNSVGSRLLVGGQIETGRFGWWIYNERLQPLQVFEFSDSVNADWSPDGKRFSIGRDIFDTQTFALQLTLEAASGIGGWTPDGTQVMAWADEARTQFGFYDSQTGAFVRSVSAGTDSVEMVNWSPNLRYFLIGDPTGITSIVSAESGEVIYTLPILYPITTSWNSDGTLLAYSYITHGVSEDTPNAIFWGVEPWVASIAVWSVIDEREIFQQQGILGTPTRLRWNPVFSELMVKTELTTTIWDVVSGELVETLFPTPGLVGLAYTSFGGRLIFGGRILEGELLDLWLRRRDELYPEATYTQAQMIIHPILQVFVPVVSLDRLNTIAESCIIPEARVTSVSDEARLAEFVIAIEGLSDEQIPAGCKADLLAVAEAIQATE